MHIVSIQLVEKLQRMITHECHDAVVSKLAVLSLSSFSSEKETIFANLFQVCHTDIVVILLTFAVCQK